MIILTHNADRTSIEQQWLLHFLLQQVASFCSSLFLNRLGDIISESATRTGIKKHRVRPVYYQLYILYAMGHICRHKDTHNHEEAIFEAVHKGETEENKYVISRRL